MLHDFSSVLSAVLLLYFGYGTVNPSGKLAETFPRKLSDTPAYLSFPGERETSVYTEGVFVGYRYYDTKEADVLFPFGHGLSYTTFAYSDLRLSHSIVREGEDVQVTVTVTNTGAVSGKETVQLYVTPPKSERHRPVGAAIIGPILQRMASAAGGATWYFSLRELYLENFMSRPNVIPTFRQRRCTNRGRNFVRSKQRFPLHEQHSLYLFFAS